MGNAFKSFSPRKRSMHETGFHVGDGCIAAFIHEYLGVSTSHHCPVVVVFCFVLFINSFRDTFRLSVVCILLKI